MGQLQEQARLWRKAFQVKSDNQQHSRQYNLQIKLIIEEYTEVVDAYDAFKQGDKSTHVALLKELADLVFVCYQAAENMGWDLDEAMQRIFDSNMSKLDDTGAPVRNETGKVMKGPNYRPPVLDDLVTGRRPWAAMSFRGVMLLPPIDCADPNLWIAERIYEMGLADGKNATTDKTTAVARDRAEDAPASSDLLVEQVAIVCAMPAKWTWDDQARAVIHTIANWLDQQSELHAAAMRLRMEVGDD